MILKVISMLKMHRGFFNSNNCHLSRNAHAVALEPLIQSMHAVPIMKEQVI